VEALLFIAAASLSPPQTSEVFESVAGWCGSALAAHPVHCTVYRQQALLSEHSNWKAVKYVRLARLRLKPTRAQININLEGWHQIFIALLVFIIIIAVSFASALPALSCSLICTFAVLCGAGTQEHSALI